MAEGPRKNLLLVFDAALQAVHGTRVVRTFLQARPLPDRPIRLLAMGKAAVAMAAGAVEVLGERITDGLVVTKDGYVDRRLPERLAIREAAHPVPDARSLAAGAEVREAVAGLPADHQLLGLTSGGASALVEALPEGIELADLIRLNQWLLGSGLPIDQVNRVRQGVSLVKGGRLAALLQGQPACNLLISDVPGDDPAFIGSGPFRPPPDASLPEELPDWVQAMLAQAARTVGAVRIPEVPHHIVASNHHAREAAAVTAESLGLEVHGDPDLLEGEVESVVADWFAGIEALAPGLHIRGGETTVRLPSNPGRGGRNQHLALAAAIRMAGRADLWLLAAGTDGSDGPTDDAGALVDGGTVARGEAEGLDARDCLARADAGTFLEASGDLIETGPTGTNVMDLVLLYKTG
jgi:hydroxypyruvate reductase